MRKWDYFLEGSILYAQKYGRIWGTERGTLPPTPGSGWTLIRTKNGGYLVQKWLSRVLIRADTNNPNTWY